MFELNEIVECINDAGFTTLLTPNKRYVVHGTKESVKEGSCESTIYIMDDSHVNRWYYSSRFKAVAKEPSPEVLKLFEEYKTVASTSPLRLGLLHAINTLGYKAYTKENITYEYTLEPI